MQERKGLKAVGYFNSFHSAAPLWLHFGTYPASVSFQNMESEHISKQQTSALAMGLLFLLASHTFLRSGLQPPRTMD